MTIGDYIYQMVCGFLILAIVCLSLFGIASLWNTEYVTEGIIVSMGYWTPYTFFSAEEMPEGYWWIEIYSNETKCTKRIKLEGPNTYQIGDHYEILE